MAADHQCVILVGGRGTRLGALTKDRPKPLLPVGGKPFLSTLIHEAVRHGFSNILLLAGFKADIFSDELAALRNGLPLSVNIDILTEPEPLGTGGALRFAAHHLRDHFLMLNGDSFFDINLLDLTSRPFPDSAIGRLGLKPQADVSRYGTVQLDGERIGSFAEKKPGAGPGLINGGVYWFRKEILDHIGTGPCSLERDVLPTLAREGRLLGTVYDNYLLDIGLPETLAQAQKEIPARLRRPAVFLDRDGVLNHDVGYAHRPEQITWVEGAMEAVKAWNDSGYYVFVVSNQAGVARGYYSEEDVRVLHRWMATQLWHAGAHIDAFAYCPYHPEGVVPTYTKSSLHRKPSPGMILDLIESWPIDIARSFLIGDNDSDIAAARAAGLPGYLFRGGNLAHFARTRSA